MYEISGQLPVCAPASRSCARTAYRQQYACLALRRNIPRAHLQTTPQGVDDHLRYPRGWCRFRRFKLRQTVGIEFGHRNVAVGVNKLNGQSRERVHASEMCVTCLYTLTTTRYTFFTAPAFVTSSFVNTSRSRLWTRRQPQPAIHPRPQPLLLAPPLRALVAHTVVAEPERAPVELDERLEGLEGAAEAAAGERGLEDGGHPRVGEDVGAGHVLRGADGEEDGGEVGDELGEERLAAGLEGGGERGAWGGGGGWGGRGRGRAGGVVGLVVREVGVRGEGVVEGFLDLCARRGR